ncbi:MAG: hypothetical protein SFW67_32725 [Myxococcaceae bacterium]|nr:hypothetical protein [Myxococcaceae bacterium]
MRATRLVSLDRTEPIIAVEQVDEQLLVATATSIEQVARAGLRPLVKDLDIRSFDCGWALTPTELISHDATRVRLPEFSGSPVRLRASAEGDFLIASHAPPFWRISRVDAHGSLLWEGTVPFPPTVSGYVSEARAREGWAVRPKAPWKATSWRMTASGLCISGDRLLAVFTEVSSGVGVGFGFDASSGQLVFQTEPAPFGETAPGPEAGSFLAGIQGYGAFETRLLDRDGRARERWPSHGLRVPGPTLRLIELENVLPSRCRVATLQPAGTVLHGPMLEGYYTSPVLGTQAHGAVFWRNGRLLALPPDGAWLDSLAAVPDFTFVSHLAGRAPGIMALAADLPWAPEEKGPPARRLLVFELSE